MVSPLKYVTSSQPLRMSEARTLAPVRARALAYSLAGRARMLYELATGSDAGGDGGGSPINPQGKLGADLSGPPFGPCIRQTLCVVEGLTAQSNVIGEQPLYTFTEEDQWWYMGLRVFVRPHHAQRGNEPLTRGYLSISYIATSGTATADLYFRYARDAAVFPQQAPVALSSGSGSITTDSTAWVPLVPGVNHLHVSLRSTSTALLRIVRLSVNQVVTQEH